MTDSTPTVLDACVCINLAAALGGRIDALRGFGEVVIVPQVREEALFLHDLRDAEIVRTRVELDSARVVELTTREAATYVELAVTLDDGEAASMAVASVRGWVLATDDRAARNRGGLGRPPVSIVTTPVLLRQHALAVGWTAEQVSEAVQAVRDKARFLPPRDDPEHGWWLTHLRSD